LMYRTLFYVNIYRSYKLLKNKLPDLLTIYGVTGLTNFYRIFIS